MKLLLRSRLWEPTCSQLKPAPRRRAHTGGPAGPASAAASAARAAGLAAACEGARTPALTGLDEPAGLTPRELEIARMAASGLSSRAIAARLVVAVRTVDNALGQVYAKLCIGGRAELASIFTVSRCAPAPGSRTATRPAHAVSQTGSQYGQAG